MKKNVSSLHAVSDLRHRLLLEKMFFMGTWSSKVISFHGCTSEQVDKRWFIQNLTGWFIFVMCSYKSYFSFSVLGDCWSYFIYSYLILIFIWFFFKYYFSQMSKFWLVYLIFEHLQQWQRTLILDQKTSMLAFYVSHLVIRCVHATYSLLSQF